MLLLVPLIAVLTAAQIQKNKQCLHSVLASSRENTFEACDLNTQIQTYEKALETCKAACGPSAAIVFHENGDVGFPFVPANPAEAYAELISLSVKNFDIDENHTVHFNYAYTQDDVDVNFVVKDDESLRTALGLAKARDFLLQLNIKVEIAWKLAMNINPDDGHNSGWAGPVPACAGSGVRKCAWPKDKVSYWDSDIQYNTVDNAFKQDYKSQAVFKEKARHITIARHANGKCTHSTTWSFIAFKAKGKDYPARDTLLNKFDKSYRSKVTNNQVRRHGMDNADPIFMSTDGFLYFNFYYSNNGARLIHSKQATSSENQNDDKSWGLGMEYSSLSGNTQKSGSNGDWWHDAARLDGNRNAQGKDHGPSMNTKGVLGSYAIFVSDSEGDAPKFNCPGDLSVGM